jgi:hypothetical protein
VVTTELPVEEALYNEGIHAKTRINIGVQRNEIKIMGFDFMSKG